MNLSIIIPAYNIEKYLERCVRSFETKIPASIDYEVIIIDDGSSDGTLAEAQRIAKDNSSIRVFHQTNQGQSVARNTGLDMATGRYIWFVDGDDYLYGDHIAEFIDTAIRTDADVVVAQMAVGYESDTPTELNLVQPVTPKAVYTGSAYILQGAIIASVCTSLYKREFLEKYELRFYPGITQQDVEFNTRAYAVAQRMVYYPEPVYFYFKNAASSTSRQSPAKVERFLLNNAIVCRECRSLSQRLEHTDRMLSQYFDKRVNSIIIGMLMSSISRTDVSGEILSRYIGALREYNLYPMHGRARSLKSTLLCRLLNNATVLKYFALRHNKNLTLDV